MERSALSVVFFQYCCSAASSTMCRPGPVHQRAGRRNSNRRRGRSNFSFAWVSEVVGSTQAPSNRGTGRSIPCPQLGCMFRRMRHMGRTVLDCKDWTFYDMGAVRGCAV
jgi:hypothetical protein